MQIRKTLLLALSFMILLGSSLNAQDMNVSSFVLDEKDNTANDDETMRFDQNGEICALIKIITDQTDFSYDVGSLGVTEVEPQEGEIWLFVPFGIKKITLRHQQFGTCEYPIPVIIESGKTYRMVLLATGSAQQAEDQTVEIRCTPNSAEILIDDKPCKLADGQASQHLALGIHSYSATAAGYIPQSGTFELKATSETHLNITLTKEYLGVGNFDYVDWKTQEPVEFLVPGTDIKFTMMPIPPAAFIQGAFTSVGGVESWDDEHPQHNTRLDGYFIGQTEVTQELWEAVMGTNPSKFKGNENPVEQVSWNDCQVFIARLNSLLGQKFRLPTEAEWECAARMHGGNGAIFSGGNDINELSWYMMNSKGTTHTVATKRTNGMGVYDMSGNVAEWCQDWYGNYSETAVNNPTGATTGTHRVCRGGSWMNTSWACRSTCRDLNTPESSSPSIGLRLAQ